MQAIEAKDEVGSARTMRNIIFDMEDTIRAADDFAHLLNDRLADMTCPISKTEQGRLNRVSGEIIDAISKTHELWEEAFEAMGGKA